jgi:hypothetical protein
MALMLAAIIALVVFLALPSGYALARTQTAMERGGQSSTHRAQTSRITNAAGVGVASGVGVVSYSNNLYVYLVGANGDLLVDMWNRSHWVWADQSTPSGTVSVGGGVGVASYSNNLYVFVQSYDPQGGLTHMWVDMWNGSSWQWADQGTP